MPSRGLVARSRLGAHARRRFGFPVSSDPLRSTVAGVVSGMDSAPRRELSLAWILHLAADDLLCCTCTVLQPKASLAKPKAKAKPKSKSKSKSKSKAKPKPKPKPKPPRKSATHRSKTPPSSTLPLRRRTFWRRHGSSLASSAAVFFQESACAPSCHPESLVPGHAEGPGDNGLLLCARESRWRDAADASRDDLMRI
ncbi:unnamed protein product [Diplocarpon coronariae]